MKTVTVKDTVIGEGLPKICVPIVAETKEGILADASRSAAGRADLVEWRADWFEGAAEITEVKGVLKNLTSRLKKIPLLFTLRTVREGGKADPTPGFYAEMNREVAAAGLADLIDVEMLRDEAAARETVAAVHSFGVKVVGSSHQFDGTPSTEEMVGRLRKIQELGADISKIAVMPRCRADVARLLEAAAVMSETYAEGPIVAISMAKLGAVSRFAGEAFGSAVTFGASGEESAPGQIEAGELCRMLQRVHGAL